MDTKHEKRRLARIELNIQQALTSSRVVRSEGPLFGRNPFYALGVGVLLTSMIAEREPEFAKEAGWAEILFTRLDPGCYGWIIAKEIPSIIRMAYSDRHVDDTKKTISEALAWGRQVANGDTTAEFLDTIAPRVGKALVDIFLNNPDERRLDIALMSQRMEWLFERAVTISGESFDEATENPAQSMRLAAMVELVAVSAGAHLYRHGAVRFEDVGNWSVVNGVLNPTTYPGFFLAAWLQRERTELPMVGPLATMAALQKAWAAETLPSLDAFLSAIMDIADMYVRAAKSSEELIGGESISAA